MQQKENEKDERKRKRSNFIFRFGVWNMSTCMNLHNRKPFKRTTTESRDAMFISNRVGLSVKAKTSYKSSYKERKQ
jgi:hypothetical protein